MIFLRWVGGAGGAEGKESGWWRMAASCCPYYMKVSEECGGVFCVWKGLEGGWVVVIVVNEVVWVLLSGMC